MAEDLTGEGVVATKATRASALDRRIVRETAGRMTDLRVNETKPLSLVHLLRYSSALNWRYIRNLISLLHEGSTWLKEAPGTHVGDDLFCPLVGLATESVSRHGHVQVGLFVPDVDPGVGLFQVNLTSLGDAFGSCDPVGV